MLPGESSIGIGHVAVLLGKTEKGFEQASVHVGKALVGIDQVAVFLGEIQMVQLDVHAESFSPNHVVGHIEQLVQRGAAGLGNMYKIEFLVYPRHPPRWRGLLLVGAIQMPEVVLPKEVPVVQIDLLRAPALARQLFHAFASLALREIHWSTPLFSQLMKRLLRLR